MNPTELPGNGSGESLLSVLLVEDSEVLAERLASGGMLRLATDWQPYALHMLETLSAVASLQNLAADGGFIPRPGERSPTRFERRGTRLGHEVWDLAFRRR